MKLRVSWYPQIPCKAFRVEVGSVSEGVKVMDMLADYDRFQLENRIKPASLNRNRHTKVTMTQCR